MHSVCLHHGETDVAYNLLKKSLDKHADTALFVLFSQIEFTDNRAQLKVAEKTFKLLPESSDAYRAMASVCERNQLAGKVKHYLEKADSCS